MQTTQPQDFIELTSRPEAWEPQATFQDALYDWLSRAPWFMISLAAHAIVFLILQAVPWNLFLEEEETILLASIEQPAEPEFIDPPEDVVEPISEVETEEIPQILDSSVSEFPVDEDWTPPQGDPDQLADSPFESIDISNLIGGGGGAGGKYGGHFGNRGRGGQGGKRTHKALADGLDWLSQHQSLEGYWDVDGFPHNNADHAASCDCAGLGDANQDVGVTSLALLAFLGDGHTTRQGLHKEVVRKGVGWLTAQQDYDSGLIGEPIGHSYMYDHGIATLALAEAYYFSKSPTLKGKLVRAIRYIEKARNPYGAWRYDSLPLGENDTSVTGWMVLALKSAEEGGIQIDKEALHSALAWIDEVTDPSNGRVGYSAPGEASSRISGVNDDFPNDSGEAMTAVGLLCRFFLGQDPSKNAILKQHADLLLRKLPVWDPDGQGSDLYYWYYGSYAMFQMGGKHWKKWNQAMKPAVLQSQRLDGHQRGSWDPIGPWGYAGGRVYSTALMTLNLEVYFRYARLLGGR